MPYSPTRRKLEQFLVDPRRRSRLFKILFWSRVYVVVAMTLGAVIFFLWVGGFV